MSEIKKIDLNSLYSSLIREIENDDFIWVYDLETENHHFHAGIGSIIVSNTDSATFDSPCLLKNIETEEILYKPICELADDNNWLNEINDRQFNVCTKYLVWCKNGWTKIKHIMRHKTDKTIHRVLTHTGCVDVTTDHSLLDINGEMIKSTECKIKDTKLYHNKYEQEWTYDYEINEEYAYLLGFFFADGTCCTTVSNKPHYEWQINNIKLEWLEKLLPIAEKYEKQEFIIQKIKQRKINPYNNKKEILNIILVDNDEDVPIGYCSLLIVTSETEGELLTVDKDDLKNFLSNLNTSTNTNDPMSIPSSTGGFGSMDYGSSSFSTF